MEISGKRKRKAILIFIIVGIILLGYGAYRLSHHEKSTADNVVSTFTVQRGDLL